MARAYSASPQQDYGQEPQGGEWSALRGELVALLDQVESQVTRSRRQDQGLEGIAERMAELRYRVAEAEPDMRHREALRSVKRAVDRFSDRDESYAPGNAYGRPADPVQQPYPGNPRDTLQSAIRQIRARQAEMGAAPARAAMDAPRFDELAHAVGGISGRLERLEAELRTQGKSQTGNVKEIAEQVASLSHVVELLAGAVGETGQVKRLEGQIAGLARLVAQGPQIDLSALTGRLDELVATMGRMNEKHDGQLGAQRQETAAINQRLDDVTATMGRLADLQVQFANRVDNAAQASTGIRQGLGSMGTELKSGMGAIEASLKDGIGSIETGLSSGMGSLDSNLRMGIGSLETNLMDGMRAIEESVRNIYDRIDTIEKHTAMSPIEVDTLTSEMARFTEAMKNPVQPQGLIELVDELNRRIASIESSHHDVGGLKMDVEALRTAVVQAVEPRFAAIEMQIEALSDRVGDRPADISVGQLEAQVRQLVARMDQTGEQLTGLARLYSHPVEREPAPDFEALAEMVAARTSEAVALSAPMPAVSGNGLSDAGIDEIERRVSRLMGTRERGSEDLGGIETSIREVSERLARLESSLTERAMDAARIAAMPVEPVLPDMHAPAPTAGVDDAPVGSGASERMAAFDPIAPLLAEAEAAAAAEVPADQPVTTFYPSTPAQEARPMAPPRADTMPANPGDDAPLTDRPFGDGNPVKTALDAKNGPRKQHPGLSYEPLPDQGAPLPPAPAPSAGFGAPAARPEFDAEAVERPPRPVSSFDAPEREAFGDPIPETGAPDSASEPPPSTNTFIAAARRAAQRQQRPVTSAAGGTGSLISRAFASFRAGGNAAETTAEKPTKARRQKKERPLAGDKESPTRWKPDNDAAEPRMVTPKASIEPVPPPPIPYDLEPRALDQEMTAPAPESTKKESLLSRYRRPILLAAALVAASLLALNLVMQRLAPEPAPEPEPISTDVSVLESETLPPLTAKPMADVATAMPRIIPMADSLATASLDPSASKGFTPTSETQAMPAAFVAAAGPGHGAPSPAVDAIETASAPPLAGAVTPLDMQAPPRQIASPVQVEMPPENLGPDALRAAAAAGDARAQFEIAAIYTEGRAVPEDAVAAAVWYERSAAQGFAPAQYRLGNLYENGRGVARDLAQARLWYQRAAEAGNRMAMHNLAALYAGGELGKQEFDAAAQWFEHAAARGMRDSQFNLGMLYARGLGVPQSLEQSYKWFSLAAKRGDADAAKARDDVARSLDAEAVSRVTDELAAYKSAPIDLVANFAPIGTWSKSFDPGATITKREVVTSVQMALELLGYEVGTPDGLAGPRTAEAIRSFERATGMSESGQVNPRLLAVLGSQPV